MFICPMYCSFKPTRERESGVDNRQEIAEYFYVDSQSVNLTSELESDRH